jgi:plastocyanin
MAMQSLFGTRTAADINLAAQMILIIGLWIGFFFARRKRFGHHANVQTAMVLANMIFILFMMGSSFYSYVIKGGTGDNVARWMIVHAVLGTIAELAGIYLLIRMRTKWLPIRLRIKRIKVAMRATLALWTVLVVLGVIVYEQRYLTVDASFSISNKTGTASAPIFQLAQAGSDLNMHAMEMQQAVDRGNLATTLRHAEHLVNLIEGSKGLHYGDLDTNGTLEDPGDGTGALVYVRRIREASNSARIAEAADALDAQLMVVRDDAVTITGATDLAAVTDLVAEAVSVARRANAEGISTLNGLAQSAGIVPLAYVEPEPAGTMADATVTILEDHFAFLPAVVTVNVGTTVVWINKERAKHTVTSDDGLFESGDQGMEQVFQFTFESPGTYNYYCRFHGDKGVVGMAGTIIVE